MYGRLPPVQSCALGPLGFVPQLSALLCICLLLTVWHASSASPLLSTHFLAYDVGRAPSSVALLDLNGDAHPDLAVANLGSSSMSVLLGNGDGTFGPATSFPTGNSPCALDSADLNADGRADVVVVDRGDNTVSVFLGNGDGTFRSRTDYVTGTSPSAVAIADLNLDGQLDLAVANFASYTVSVLLGNGDGTFQPKMDFGTGRNPRSVAIGDMNGDAVPDLVTANFGHLLSGIISVLLGNGDGTFHPRIDSGMGSGASAVALADLNGDGHVDAAIGYSCAGEQIYPSSISIFFGNGDGAFGAETALFSGACPGAVAIADVNGDSKLDVATANGDSVFIFSGNGTGGFDARAGYVTGVGSVSIAVGDVNHDGQPDLVFPDQQSDTVSILIANPDGTFGHRIPSLSTIGPQYSVAIADFDLDGALDIAVPIWQPPLVRVWLGRGDGTFGSTVDTPIQAAALVVTAGDLDRDGRPDVAIATWDNSLSVLLGNGDGSFRLGVTLPAGGSGRSIAIADLNSDSWPDVTLAIGSGAAVFLADGAGSLMPGQVYSTGFDPSSVAIGDLNRDNKSDLAVACSAGDVWVLLGNGDGTFRASTGFEAGSEPVSAAIGDLNEDGSPDLAVANFYYAEYDGRVSILLGIGDGSFAPPVQYRTGYNPHSIAIVDLNNDRKPDIAAGTSYASNTVSLLTGRGDGTFAPKTEFGVGGNLIFLTAGDIRADGWLDLVGLTGPENPTRVFVLINQGEIATSVSYPLGPSRRQTFLHRPVELWPGGPIRVGYTVGLPTSLLRLAIYDARGHLVRVLYDGSRSSGEYEAIWQRGDRAGIQVARGVYFVRLGTEVGTDSRKLLLIQR